MPPSLYVLTVMSNDGLNQIFLMSWIEDTVTVRENGLESVGRMLLEHDMKIAGYATSPNATTATLPVGTIFNVDEDGTTLYVVPAPETKLFINESSIVAIADAIRAKTGSTEKMSLSEMPTAIDGISGGVKVGIAEYTGNGQKAMTFDGLLGQPVSWVLVKSNTGVFSANGTGQQLIAVWNLNGTIYYTILPASQSSGYVQTSYSQYVKATATDSSLTIDSWYIGFTFSSSATYTLLYVYE